MERALRWLATTDIRLAELRVEVLRTEYMADVAESLAYSHLEGSVEDRKRGAKASTERGDAMEKFFVATREYEKLRAQRKSAELLINAWQSVNANRRQAGRV